MFAPPKANLFLQRSVADDILGPHGLSSEGASCISPLHPADNGTSFKVKAIYCHHRMRHYLQCDWTDKLGRGVNLAAIDTDCGLCHRDQIVDDCFCQGTVSGMPFEFMIWS